MDSAKIPKKTNQFDSDSIKESYAFLQKLRQSLIKSSFKRVFQVDLSDEQQVVLSKYINLLRLLQDFESFSKIKPLNRSGREVEKQRALIWIELFVAEVQTWDERNYGREIKGIMGFLTRMFFFFSFIRQNRGNAIRNTLWYWSKNNKKNTGKLLQMKEHFVIAKIQEKIFEHELLLQLESFHFKQIENLTEISFQSQVKLATQFQKHLRELNKKNLTEIKKEEKRVKLVRRFDFSLKSLQKKFRKDLQKLRRLKNSKL